MRITVDDFSFFAKDVEHEIEELKVLLDRGHILELIMTRSSSLNDDICKIIYAFKPVSIAKSNDYAYAFSCTSTKYYDKTLTVELRKMKGIKNGSINS